MRDKQQLFEVRYKIYADWIEKVNEMYSEQSIMQYTKVQRNALKINQQNLSKFLDQRDEKVNYLLKTIEMFSEINHTTTDATKLIREQLIKWQNELLQLYKKLQSTANEIGT